MISFFKNFSFTDSIFSKNQDCVTMFKSVLANKERLYKNNSNCSYTNRYCSQVQFNILVCGGYNYTSKSSSAVASLNIFNKIKNLPPMKKERNFFEAVCSKGEVYVFGGYNSFYNWVKIIEKFSPSTNTWTEVTNMFDERQKFCTCAFMNKMYIFGGSFYNRTYNHLLTTSSCLEFNTKHNSFKNITRMNVGRRYAACVAFQGNIVVSGGMDFNDSNLNSVESYDVFANTWSTMPNTINRKSFHNLVVVKEKLFVIDKGIDSCEVYDNVCKKFVSLKNQPSIAHSKCVPMCNKIIIFQEKISSLICYDVNKDEWAEESCQVTRHLQDFSLAKLPQY